MLTTTIISRVSFASLALLTAAGQAAQISVPGDYGDLQSAVDAAAAGDEIIVAPGTYHGNLRIAKPLTIRSTGGEDQTTLRGDGNGPAVVLECGESGGATLTGFTISGGNGMNGGGLFLCGDVAVIGCTVTGNTAENGGGAFLVGSPMLSDVRFTGNTATRGGGVFLSPDADALLDLCNFSGNSADAGGAAYVSPRSSRTTYATFGAGDFEYNTAGEGGGIYAEMGGVEIVDASFRENEADRDGGAIYLANNEYSSVTGSTFEDGRADRGAAVFAKGDGEFRIGTSDLSGHHAQDTDGAVSIAEGYLLALQGSRLWSNAPENLVGEWEDLGDNEFSAPAMCDADLATPHGVLDIRDVMRFLDLFVARDPAVDFAAPHGMYDLMDLIHFINQYYGGGCGS